MSPQAATRLLAVVCLIGAGPALAGLNNDPGKWLERMSTAMSQMSYQGTFVYLQGDDVVTMRITHVAGEMGVRERLVSLSGNALVHWPIGEILSFLRQGLDYFLKERNEYPSIFFASLQSENPEQAPEIAEKLHAIAEFRNAYVF